MLCYKRGIQKSTVEWFAFEAQIQTRGLALTRCQAVSKAVCAWNPVNKECSSQGGKQLPDRLQVRVKNEAIDDQQWSQRDCQRVVLPPVTRGGEKKLNLF
jgi:hypothetical protein